MTQLAFVNGTIRTIDPNRPVAEALLVDGDAIVAVGGVDEVREAVTGPTEVVDLDGRCLLPGLIDAHCHPSQAGLEMAACNLLDAPEDRDAYLVEIARYAAANPDSEWITGGGWSMGAFPGGAAAAALLDEVVPDRPVVLWNRDHHGVWVNSTALGLAGIDETTPDPPDGRIERRPLGTLHEGAADSVLRLAPRPTDRQRRDAIVVARERLLSLGITGWQDAWVAPDVHEAYLGVAGEGRLVADVVGCLWWQRDEDEEAQIGRLVAQRQQTPVGSYRATTVKIMQDGVVENFTAAMLAPYLGPDGAPTDNSGHSFIEPAALSRAARLLDDAGFQVHFHALGDRAVRECLDAVAAARESNGSADHRHLLAHLQLVDPADRSRFADLGLGATAQPLWAHHDTYQDELTIPFLGPERATAQYPWRSLIDAGARLVFGSDWPVSSPDPFEGMHVAVERHHPDGHEPVFIGDQRITIEEALAAYTTGSAWACHRDDVAGSLSPGKRADLIVTDRDPVGDGPFGTRVDLTFVGGEAVFER
jgi:predicted amidohydrolase YtcJ